MIVRTCARWTTRLALLLGPLLPCTPSAFADPLFTFGAIADCQYCAVEGTGIRKYAISDGKLRRAVDHFNTLDLAYVVHLGDFIDRDFESFDVVNPIFADLRAPGLHVLGNHDFSVADSLKGSVLQKLGLSAPYYDFALKGWRFIVVDGNDISFYAHPEGTAEYREAVTYYESHGLDAPKWNGAVGPEQLAWIRSVLERATAAGENVVFLCHFPIYPEGRHNLWNAPEVRDLVSSYRCTRAWINGHNHAGGYGAQNGIHYLTLKGMVDTEETAYATIQVHPDRLEVTGYDREESRTLYLASPSVGTER